MNNNLESNKEERKQLQKELLGKIGSFLKRRWKLVLIVLVASAIIDVIINPSSQDVAETGKEIVENKEENKVDEVKEPEPTPEPVKEENKEEEVKVIQEQEDRKNFLKSFIDKPIPYNKLNEYGNIETLEGTNNEYYVGYLEKINMSFISKKDNDIIFFTGDGKDSAIQEKNRLIEARTATIEKQFSIWNGEHVKLTRIIKENMNNPKSYKHVKTGYFDMGDHIIINTTFRGENAFGGTVTNIAKGKASLDGENVELLEIL
jgi:hypothetical protein